MKHPLTLGWQDAQPRYSQFFLHDYKIWRDSDDYPIVLASISWSKIGKGIRRDVALVFDHETLGFHPYNSKPEPSWVIAGTLKPYPGRVGLLKAEVFRRDWVGRRPRGSNSRATIVLPDASHEQLRDLMMLSTEAAYTV